jgi:hypothetical protein
LLLCSSLLCCSSLLFCLSLLQELELRIETQKQTLQARDESIKKLLEMLQNKGVGKFVFSSSVACSAICMQSYGTDMFSCLSPHPPPQKKIYVLLKLGDKLNPLVPRFNEL